MRCGLPKANILSLSFFELFTPAFPAGSSKAKKKADVVEHPEAFHHVGLLVN